MAVVVLGHVVHLARHPHLRIPLMLAHLQPCGQRMFERAGGEQAGVLHIEHAVLVLGVHLAPARGGLEERRGVAFVSLVSV
ncbi:hypothetical protein D3C76_1699800 [compost metagenome]